MTNARKQTIHTLRGQGQTTGQIAAALGMSVNTVKSFFRRERQGKDYCKNCRVLLEQVSGGRRKIFCSDKCRYCWWNKHRDQMQQRAVYTMTCAGCGATFESYGNRNRKFCTHQCYVQSRWPE